MDEAVATHQQIVSTVEGPCPTSTHTTTTTAFLEARQGWLTCYPTTEGYHETRQRKLSNREVKTREERKHPDYN